MIALPGSHRAGVGGDLLLAGVTTYAKGLEPLVGSPAQVTVRGQLYKKPAGKKKADASAPLKLLILEVQKKE
jgi:hypothetical protein